MNCIRFAVVPGGEERRYVLKLDGDADLTIDPVRKTCSKLMSGMQELP